MSSDYFSHLQSQASKESTPSDGSLIDSFPLPNSLPPRYINDSARDIAARQGSGSPPLPSDDTTRNAEGDMDPRRLTPTLQASLVAEILTLRREIESQNRVIDGLESNFDTIKSENEVLSEKILQGLKESRIADQRFQNLERGTREAVEDLVRERDEANNSNSKTKSKLRGWMKTTKELEDRVAKVQSAQEHEKQAWEDERRRLERLLHVSETRNAALVKHLEDRQMTADEQDIRTSTDSGAANDSDGGSGIPTPRPYGHRRGQSSISTIRSIARSLDNPRKYAHPRALADELEFEEENDYDLDDFEHNDDELFSDSRLGLSDSRLGFAAGHASTVRAGDKAKKILGLTDETTTSSSRTGTPVSSLSAARPDTASSVVSGVESVQFFPEARRVTMSRFSSIGIQPSWVAPAPACDKDTDNRGSGTEAILARVNDEEPRTCNTSTSTRDNAQWQDKKSNAAMLPSHGLMSPPETPSSGSPTCQGCDTEPGSSETRYKSCATQTEHFDLSRQNNDPASTFHVVSQQLPIPCISIHPPASGQDSQGRPVLPPGTAHHSTQTDGTLLSSCCDASVQTVEIRIDNRPVKLPPHLLPSTLESALDQVEQRFRESEQKFRESAMSEAAPSQTLQGPSTVRRNSNRHTLKAINLPRPTLRATDSGDESQDHEVSSLGIEDVLIRAGHLSILSSGSNWASWRDLYDEAAREAKLEAAGKPEHTGQSSSSDNPSGPVRHQSIFSDPQWTGPENREKGPAHHPPGTKPANVSSKLSRKTPMAELEGGGHVENTTRTDSSRIDLGQNEETAFGRTDHGSTQPPPYPIPGRTSSFNPSSGSSTASSNRIPHDETSSGRSDLGSPTERTVTKTRSSSTIRPSKGFSKRRRRAAYLSPIQSMAFDGSITIERAPLSAPLKQPSTSSMRAASEVAATDLLDDNEPLSDHSDSEGVLVDAIATAMVGDWLWKSVRRKKSFGIGDPAPGDDFMHGAVRHKRWVWLSPYERTVMWSSKQPSSGVALMGKYGRKLTIKSVLDVKDVSPLPKSMLGEAIFDRSILVLTPERALKFTAPTRDRHYLWLSALSFLADTGRGPPGIPRGPTWNTNIQSNKSPLDNNTPSQSTPTLNEPYHPRRSTTTEFDNLSPRTSRDHHHRKRSLTTAATAPLSSTAISTTTTPTFRPFSSNMPPLTLSLARSGPGGRFTAVPRNTTTDDNNTAEQEHESLNPLRMNAFVRGGGGKDAQSMGYATYANNNAAPMPPYLPTPPVSAKMKLPLQQQQQQDMGRGGGGGVEGGRRPSYGEERRVGFVFWEKDKDLFSTFG